MSEWAKLFYGEECKWNSEKSVNEKSLKMCSNSFKNSNYKLIYVSTGNILWKITISKIRRATRVALIFVSVDLFNGWLDRRQQDTNISLCICGHMLFWSKNMKKIWPCTDVYLEKKEYFNSFFQIIVDILGFSIKTWQVVSFLMFRCSGRLETSINKLSYSYIKIHWLVLHFEWILFTNAWFYNCVHWSFEK